MKICSICNDSGFKHSCPTCKRNARNGGPLKSCVRCDVTTQVFAEGLCKRCLKQLGLKECRVCKKTQLERLAFYQKRNVCIECETEGRKKKAPRTDLKKLQIILGMQRREYVPAGLLSAWLHAFKRYVLDPQSVQEVLDAIEQELTSLS